jgi:hypothetical protein
MNKLRYKAESKVKQKNAFRKQKETMLTYEGTACRKEVQSETQSFWVIKFGVVSTLCPHADGHTFFVRL